MDVATITAALNKAAKPPKITKKTEDPTELYLKVLKKVVAVVREVETRKDAGQLSEADWSTVLSHADKLTSELCFEQYEDEVTDQVGPYALPLDEGNHLKTKLSIPFRGFELFTQIFVSISLLNLHPVVY